MPTRRLLLPLAALTSACSAGGVEYALDLDIFTPGNQAPFAELDRLTLTLEPARGEGERFDLSGTSGNPQVDRLGELVDTRIAIEGWVGEELVSFGRTASITVQDGDERTEPLLVADVDAFAWLTALDIGRGMGAAASDGQGSFFVFGGATNIAIQDGDSTNAVLKINVAPPDEALRFEQVTALPEYEGQADGRAHSARVGHSATLLTEGPNEGQILIAGGSEEYILLESTTFDAALFDPATEVFTPLSGAMVSSRTNHLAIPNAQGDVVLLGGWGSTTGNLLVPRDSAEVYVARDNRFVTVSGDLPGEGLYGAGANLGTAGVLYCGGATLLGGTWEADDACVTISVSGELSSAEPMPAALAQAAMAPLSGGEALVTGGLSVSAADGVDIQFESVAAERGAWIYNAANDTWREAETPMVLARAYHAAVALPDGRVLIVGGAADGELFYSDANSGGGATLACAELYTPGEGFSLLDPTCSASSATGDLPTQAHFPVVAADAVYGVIVAGGITGEARGSDAAALWVPHPGDR